MTDAGRPKWLARLLPLSPRHRASCTAVYVPVVVYLASAMMHWSAYDDGIGKVAAVLLVAAGTLAGPFCPFVCALGLLPEELIPFGVCGALLVPYFVLARHDIGTMPWSWWLALSTLWCGVSWWIISSRLK